MWTNPFLISCSTLSVILTPSSLPIATELIGASKAKFEHQINIMPASNRWILNFLKQSYNFRTVSFY
jgi:hypothetical protein